MVLKFCENTAGKKVRHKKSIEVFFNYKMATFQQTELLRPKSKTKQKARMHREVENESHFLYYFPQLVKV
jgi:hypothetical protein